MKGAREGQGTVSTLNLEEVNLRFVIVNNMVTSATVYIMFCSVASEAVPMMTLVVRAGWSESYHGELRLGSAGGPGQDGDG